VKAIRIYEKKGIILPAKTDPITGYRYYSADQVKQVNVVVELKSLGFSLAEIKKIMNGKMNKDQLMSALDEKKLTWLDAIARAEYKMDSIDTIISRINKSKEARKLDELTDEQRAWLLVKMVCVEETAVQSTLSEAIWL
jgi:DNA-binding transcriptional MerR regulator